MSESKYKMVYLEKLQAGLFPTKKTAEFVRSRAIDAVMKKRSSVDKAVQIWVANFPLWMSK